MAAHGRADKTSTHKTRRSRTLDRMDATVINTAARWFFSDAPKRFSNFKLARCKSVRRGCYLRLRPLSAMLLYGSEMC